MRETRLSGSEEGGTEPNQFSHPYHLPDVMRRPRPFLAPVHALKKTIQHGQETLDLPVSDRQSHGRNEG